MEKKIEDILKNEEETQVLLILQNKEDFAFFPIEKELHPIKAAICICLFEDGDGRIFLKGKMEDLIKNLSQALSVEDFSELLKLAQKAGKLEEKLEYVRKVLKLNNDK